MHSAIAFLAISLLSSTTLAAPTPNRLSTRQTPSYQCYKGTDFPDQSTWVSYDTLWQNDLPGLSQYNSDNENNALTAAVKNVAAASGVDPRIILSQVMQESSGNIHAVCWDQDKSCGPMQVQTTPKANACEKTPIGTCSSDTITYLIQAGVLGRMSTSIDPSPQSPQSPGIAYALQQQGGNVAQAYRVYNSGSIYDQQDYSHILCGSTVNYVSDLGNRLRGVLPSDIMNHPDCGWPACVPPPSQASATSTPTPVVAPIPGNLGPVNAPSLKQD